MMSQPSLNRQRYTYLDFLRILASFLVIVNHTNSLVFEKLQPSNLTWWFSLTWYYISKVAVPLFVMVSGACLLPRQDTYRHAFGRFLRVLVVLILFSYLYYGINLWEANWTWKKALDIPGFLSSIWSARITDSFWYLYFYLGLMVMLPILQRLASAMKKRDVEYFMSVSFLIYAIWPLVVHYVPAAALPAYFDVPLFSVFVGLFFTGYYLSTYAGKANRALSALLIAATVAASVWLTYLETGRVTAGAKYWFMDERTAPSIFTILCAIGIMLFAKRAFEHNGQRSESSVRHWAVAGGCAFGIYLLQDLLIAESRYRFFVPMQGAINPLLAALLWEIAVFAVAFAIAWLLKHVPGLHRLL